jgi:hypothetical protein
MRAAVGEDLRFVDVETVGRVTWPWESMITGSLLGERIVMRR